MTWAFEQKLPGNIKLVLLALADNANDDGYCWPSQEVIADKSSMTTRNLRRVLAALEERGYIRIDERRRPDGYKASNGYQLSPDKLSAKSSPDIQGSSQRTTVSYQEPSEEPPVIESAGAKADDQAWVRFWELYPRKVAKPAALRAWNAAIKTTEPDLIVIGLGRHLPSMKANDPKFVPHPATWLNNARWNDEPEPIKSTGTKAERPKVPTQDEWMYR